MKVYALWYGGSSYSSPDPLHDVETFPSIAHAARRLADRYNSNSTRPAWFAYANRPHASSYVPAVTHDSELRLYLADPDAYTDHAGRIDLADCYPDRIVRFGPRGGVRVEVA